MKTRSASEYWPPRTSLAALLFLLFFALLIRSGAQTVVSTINENTRQQIGLLEDEKASRTPEQQKLDSQFNLALRQKRFGVAVPGLASLHPSLFYRKSGLLLVDLQADVNPELLKFISNNAGVVISSFRRYDAVRAEVSLELIDALSKRPDVRSVRPADEAVVNGGALFQGDVAHTADLARQIFLASGRGIKIGVLSDSIDYLDLVQQQGTLPTVTILPGQSGNGTGEGTAMLEIVHALAPDSGLYFATAFSGVASFAQNIRDLYSAGCRIIVDDVLYFNESPFQDGPISQAINDVSAGGALFFSSAANGGGIDRNTSGTWEGNFRDGGPATIGLQGRLHDFGGATYNTVIPGGALRRIDLFWADPLGASTNDYDVYVLDSNGNVVRSSTNTQNGHSDPYESISALNIGERIVIVKHSGDARFLHLSTLRGRLQMATSGSAYGHNASGATNAFSVAATAVGSPAVPFVAGNFNKIESFSSDGPRRIFFHPDGTPLTPGNFSSTGGVVLQKPDLTAADGVNTTVPGFAPFFGTSAAAPHAAAIAAQVWSYDNSLAPLDVRRVMTETALDIAAPGWDQDSGAGIVMAYPALSDTLPSVQNVQVLDSNGNGNLDANECADLFITLVNHEGQTFTGVTGVLSSTVSGVQVDPMPRTFPELLPGGSAVSTTPFRVSTQPGFVCGSNVTFVLQLWSSNHGPFSQTFQLGSLTTTSGPPVTFVSTNIPAPIPDVASVDSEVTVSGINFPLAEVSVGVYITHSYDQDLVLSLIGPDGTSVLLSANNGLSGQNYGVGCNTLTVFSDDASTNISSADAPFLGMFKPQQPLRAFAAKFGNQVNGTWTLHVEDTSQFDLGTVQCWSLNLAPISCIDAGGQCLVPPQITQEPQELLTTNGALARFTIIAQGSEPLTYQWYFNSSNRLIGATTSTLALNNVTPADAGTYTVVVTNFYGSVTSAPAKLTVIFPPTLACGPGRVVELGVGWEFDEPAATGSNAVVTVVGTTTNTACGLTFTATRTWVVTDVSNFQAVCSQTIQVVDTTPPTLNCPGQRDVVYGTAWNFEPPTVQDLNGVTLALLSAQTNADCGLGFTAQQTWRAVDDCGNASVCTETVHVIDQNAPLIVTQPQDQIVVEGHAATLQVEVVGCLPSFQWYINETNLLADATNAILVLSNVVEAQTGPYTVVITNNYGSLTSQVAQLTVGVPAQILSGPDPEATTSGQGVQFQVVSGGTEPLFYQWYFNSIPLLDATNTSLAFASVTPAEAGAYQVSVSNAFGSTTSVPVRLIILGSPIFVTQPLDQIVHVGGSITFTAAATGFPQPAYQWVRNGTNFLGGETGTDLALSNVQDEDAGQYTLLASNAVATVTSQPALLTVLDSPAIVVQPVSVIANEGATVLLTVQALGKQPLTYQWFSSCSRPISGATTATLRLKNVTHLNAGSYCVTVSNASGSVISDAAVLDVLVVNLLSLSRTGTSVSLAFSTVVGLEYSVFYKNDLAEADWLQLTAPTLATGTSMTVHDSTTPDSHRFYQILVQVADSNRAPK